jgi:hypothetical protein
MNWFGKKKEEPAPTTTSRSGSGGTNAASTIIKLKSEIENQEKRLVVCVVI